jgi:hypothetical protein
MIPKNVLTMQIFLSIVGIVVLSISLWELNEIGLKLDAIILHYKYFTGSHIHTVTQTQDLALQKLKDAVANRDWGEAEVLMEKHGLRDLYWD